MGDTDRGTAVLDSGVAARLLSLKTAGLSTKAYQELKTQVHRDLLNRVDLGKLMHLGEKAARLQIFAAIQDLIRDLIVPLSSLDRQQMAREVLDEVFGLGP